MPPQIPRLSACDIVGSHSDAFWIYSFSRNLYSDLPEPLKRENLSHLSRNSLASPLLLIVTSVHSFTHFSGSDKENWPERVKEALDEGFKDLSAVLIQISTSKRPLCIFRLINAFAIALVKLQQWRSINGYEVHFHPFQWWVRLKRRGRVGRIIQKRKSLEPSSSPFPSCLQKIIATRERGRWFCVYSQWLLLFYGDKHRGKSEGRGSYKSWIRYKP